MEASPHLYRWIIESSGDAMWMTDREGRMVFANPRLAELLDRPLAEVQAMSAFDMFDDTGRENFRDHLVDLETLDQGRDHVEVLLLRRDGVQVWSSCSYFPVVDDDGSRIGWMHRLTEFTALKDLNEQLRRSESRLADAQRVSRVGSWDWDVVDDVLTWSDELYRMLDITPEDVPVTFDSYLDLVHPDDRQVAEQAIAAVFTGVEQTKFDARMRPRRGGEIWVRGIGFVERAPDGSPLRIGGTAQDVTDFKRAEAATARASARFQLLQTMAAAANEATSVDQAVRGGANELARTAGWTATAAFLPDGAGGLTAVDGGGPASAVDRDLARAAYRSGIRQLVRATVPTEPWATRLAIPVLLHGEVVCVVVLGGDVDESDPELPAIMDQALGQLSRVAEREQQAAHLAAARDDAVEASRLKSEFLSTMSHEIRTPMNGVIGLTDLLQRTDLDADQRRLAEGLHDTGQTLLYLINDILDLSKIEAGHLELELVDFDLRAAFDRTATVIAEPARRKGLDLRISADPEVPRRLRGDPGRLVQVLVNLGSNAVKFTERGEVVIRASLAVDDPSTLRIEVTDTGVGIDPGQGERLFDAFVQADPSTTRRHGGTGLGLAICRQLVEAMGGRIGVTGRPGQGSTFWFTLPVETVAADPAADPEAGSDAGSDAGDRPDERSPSGNQGAWPPGRRRWPGRTILVAEDNRVNQIVARGLLEVLGLTVVVVDNGEAAVAAATGAVAYDAVLMDCRMPLLDGYDAAREIRRREPAGTRVPIIALSASALASERAKCLAAGMDDFVAKPVELDRLEQALVRWMRPTVTPDGTSLDPVLYGSDSVPDEPRVRAPRGEQPWLDVERVDVAREVMLAGMVADGRSLWERATERFRVDAPALRDAIAAAVSDGDAKALEAAAHRLHGSAANLGLTRLVMLAQLLEARGERGRLDDGPLAVTTLVDALGTEIGEVVVDVLVGPGGRPSELARAPGP